MTVNVMFVCLGNICRSPTAHGVFRHFVQEQGLTDKINIESCGTGDWHIGEPPDSRATATAKKRGYDLSDLRARHLSSKDFAVYDYILVMDKSNLQNAQSIAPKDYQGTLALFLDFADLTISEVPDPYYGGQDGFERVLDMVENASIHLLEHIKQHDLN